MTETLSGIMRYFIILVCCLPCFMTSHAQDKEAAVNAATELLSRWRKADIVTVEQEISRMTNVVTLRIVAFASRAASFPEKAEEVAVDSRLNKIFWASVRALCEIQTDDAKSARRIILDSGLVQGGDRILFKTFEERGQGVRTSHGNEENGGGRKVQNPADKTQGKP